MLTLTELLACFAGGCFLGVLTGAVIDVLRRRSPRVTISPIVIGGLASSFTLMILHSPWVRERVDNASLLGSDLQTKTAVLLSNHIYLASAAVAVFTAGLFRLAFPTRDKQRTVAEPPIQEEEDKGPVYRSLAVNRALLFASAAGMSLSALAQILAVALPTHAPSSDYTALEIGAFATFVALWCNTKSRAKGAANPPKRGLFIRLLSSCIPFEWIVLMILYAFLIAPDPRMVAAGDTHPFAIWTIGNPAYQSLQLLMNSATALLFFHLVFLELTAPPFSTAHPPSS